MQTGNVYKVQFKKVSNDDPPVAGEPQAIKVFAEDEDGAKDLVNELHATDTHDVEILGLHALDTDIAFAADDVDEGELESDEDDRDYGDLPEDGQPKGEFDKCFAPEETVTIEGKGETRVSDIVVGDVFTDGLKVVSITKWPADGFPLFRVAVPAAEQGATPEYESGDAVVAPTFNVGDKVRFTPESGNNTEPVYTVKGDVQAEGNGEGNVLYQLEEIDGMFLASTLTIATEAAPESGKEDNPVPHAPSEPSDNVTT